MNSSKMFTKTPIVCYWGQYISVGLYKKGVTPLLMHWSYFFFPLIHRYGCLCFSRCHGNSMLYKVCYVAKFVLPTHWGQVKMTALFQTTFWNGFSWMKMYEFWLEFHWNLFLGVQLTIFQLWLRWWLCANQVTSYYLNQWWLYCQCMYVSLGLNELICSSGIGKNHEGFETNAVFFRCNENALICQKKNRFVLIMHLLSIWVTTSWINIDE